MCKPVLETNLKNLPLIAKGKVRDIYEVDENHMLIVTSISSFASTNIGTSFGRCNDILFRCFYEFFFACKIAS